jgi:hypothetical protein
VMGCGAASGGNFRTDHAGTSPGKSDGPAPDIVTLPNSQLVGLCARTIRSIAPEALKMRVWMAARGGRWKACAAGKLSGMTSLARKDDARVDNE